MIGVVGAGVVSGDGTARQAAPTSDASPTTIAATATPSTTPSSTTTDAPTPRPSIVAGARDRVRFGAAPVLGEATGLAALVVSGDRVFRVDLDDPVVTLAGLDVHGTSVVARSTLGLLVFSYDRRPVLYGADGAAPVALGADDGAGAGYAGEGPPGRLWFTDYANGAPRLRFVEPAQSVAAVDVDLADVNGSTAIRVVTDGTLGALVVAPGGTYLATGDAPPRRVTTGVVSAAAGGFALEHTCDVRLRCTAAMLDLRSGVRRTLPVSLPDATGFGGLVAPDGRFAVTAELLGASNDTIRARLAVAGVDGTTVDLGATASLCVAGCQGAPTWSPDGRWLAGLRDSATLWFWRPGLDAARTIELPNATLDGWLLSAQSMVLVPRAWSLSTAPAPAS